MTKTIDDIGTVTFQQSGNSIDNNNKLNKDAFYIVIALYHYGMNT